MPIEINELQLRARTMSMEDRMVALEEVLQVNDGELTLALGDASITLKKNGDVTIKGKEITLSASGKISVKAANELTLKGARINQN